MIVLLIIMNVMLRLVVVDMDNNEDNRMIIGY